MQFNILFANLAVSAVAVHAQTVTNTATPNASQWSRISVDISSIYENPFTRSACAAASTFAATAEPEAQATILTARVNTNNWGPYVSTLNSVLQATASRTDAGLPTEVQSCLMNLNTAVASAINKDMANVGIGTRVDRAVVAVGAVLLAGSVVVLAL